MLPQLQQFKKRGYIENESKDGVERISKLIVLKEGNIEETEKTYLAGVEKKKLFPTDIGIVVTDFLKENFSNIMEYSFTASVENEFDEIAEGKKVWNQMIASFYKGFHSKVSEVVQISEKAVGQRDLGIDPASGKKVIVRIGPFGPMAQIGEKQEDENAPKPKFASLLKTQKIQTITLNEALDLFKLPRKVGLWNGKEIVTAIGRFGPYLRYDGKFTSIKKTDEEEPLTITLERSIELIKIKMAADKERVISSFDGVPSIQVLNGRYGPFIQIVNESNKKINIKIPKDKIPKDLTKEDCLILWKNRKGKTDKSN